MDKEPSNPQKLSKDFEEDLDEFFKDRAKLKAAHFSDKDKLECSKHREAEKPHQMSGCCMTGCHDCPWGYKIK